jgi:hypothetical protein
MTEIKVQLLSKKLAETTLHDEYRNEKIRLIEFSENFLIKMRAILNELEGDIFSLKDSNFSYQALQELIEFWRKCINLYKNFNENSPYKEIELFINLIKDNSSWIVKIMPLIKRHIKSQTLDLQSKFLTPIKIEGLKKLILLIENSGQYIKKNPLLPDPTYLLPKLNLYNNENITSGPENVTKIENISKYNKNII